MHSNLRIGFALLLAAFPAGSLSAQAPSATAGSLASEGINASLPDGFPAFEHVAAPDSSRSRSYRTHLGSRVIAVAILPAFAVDASDELRRELLEVGRIRTPRDSAQAESDIIREDSLHFIREYRRTREDGRRGIGRIYITRVGPPVITTVLVFDAVDAPDPATDPAILAFLDAARPGVAPSPLLNEGIDAAPPAGYTAFELEPRESGRSRMYMSRSNGRVIGVDVTDPVSSWNDAGGEARRGMMDARTRALSPERVRLVGVREDSTHVIGDYRMVMENGTRGIERVYIPRRGAPTVVVISVIYGETEGDPGTDPQILAFLDAARPKANTGRQAPITFRRRGLEMVLPPGIVPPSLNPGLRARDMEFLMSRSGNRLLLVVTLDNTERGSSAWPAERRVQYLHRRLNALLFSNAREVEQEARTAGDLTFRDLRFDQLSGQSGAGRGRVYTTLSGPHRLISVLYFELGSSQLPDEAEIEAMLDSVRVLAQP